MEIRRPNQPRAQILQGLERAQTEAILNGENELFEELHTIQDSLEKTQGTKASGMLEELKKFPLQRVSARLGRGDKPVLLGGLAGFGVGALSLIGGLGLAVAFPDAGANLSEFVGVLVTGGVMGAGLCAGLFGGFGVHDKLRSSHQRIERQAEHLDALPPVYSGQSEVPTREDLRGIVNERISSAKEVGDEEKVKRYEGHLEMLQKLKGNDLHDMYASTKGFFKRGKRESFSNFLRDEEARIRGLSGGSFAETSVRLEENQVSQEAELKTLEEHLKSVSGELESAGGDKGRDSLEYQTLVQARTRLSAGVSQAQDSLKALGEMRESNEDLRMASESLNFTPSFTDVNAASQHEVQLYQDACIKQGERLERRIGQLQQAGENSPELESLRAAKQHIDSQVTEAQSNVDTKRRNSLAHNALSVTVDYKMSSSKAGEDIQSFLGRVEAFADAITEELRTFEEGDEQPERAALERAQEHLHRQASQANAALRGHSESMESERLIKVATQGLLASRTSETLDGNSAELRAALTANEALLGWQIQDKSLADSALA